MKIILDSFTQTVPESNVANADFTRTNNTQSLADANRDVVQTKYSLTAYGEKSHVLRKNNSVQKFVNNRLSKTHLRALPHGTAWVDKPSFTLRAVRYHGEILEPSVCFCTH